MSDFAALALRAVTDLGVRGDFTAILALCDYLQERDDPRGERIRAVALADRSRISTERFDTTQVTERYCRRYLCTPPEHILYAPNYCSIPEDLVQPSLRLTL